ncbi:hypothetical protein Vadar_010347 [Vaccinium darrowii]|uniref:Uncharacterized protein n=1 Tax=Vaccinium darrowii TaxID=229202 RepID=A0ACB7XGY0_9ERIC|nr:hypothetical protein Vadar_010347 [Vaccinium darrowii]
MELRIEYFSLDGGWKNYLNPATESKILPKPSICISLWEVVCLWACYIRFADNAEETALSVLSGTAVSSPEVQEPNETLQSLDRRMHRKEMEVKSLQKRVKKIQAEGLELDRRADETISTYGTSVHVTMLFHGFGSIFLQLNYPNSGTSVSVLMVVSFFSTFAVAYIVSFNKIEKMSQWEKDLRRRQRELQNDIACFGPEIMRTYSDEEFKSFVSIGAVGEVWNWIGSLNRDAGALQNTITGVLEISSNSESSRSKSLSQVAAHAIMYGFSFPVMAYLLLSCKCL